MSGFNSRLFAKDEGVRRYAEELARETDSLVAAFIRANPTVPISDIVIISEPSPDYSGQRIRIGTLKKKTEDWEGTP